MTDTHDTDVLGIRRFTPPRTPREWTVCVAIPDGVAIDDHDTHDRLAAAAAPDGYVLSGTIPVRPKGGAKDDRKSWRIRVRYVPASWQRQLLAPVAVYCAAQMAGISTDLDDRLVSTCDSLQWYSPDGRPVRREGRRWVRELPDDIARAVGEIEEHYRRLNSDYYDRKPDRVVAGLLYEAGRQRLARAQKTIRAWVTEHYPQIVVC